MPPPCPVNFLSPRCHWIPSPLLRAGCRRAEMMRVVGPLRPLSQHCQDRRGVDLQLVDTRQAATGSCDRSTRRLVEHDLPGLHAGPHDHRHSDAFPRPEARRWRCCRGRKRSWRRPRVLGPSGCRQQRWPARGSFHRRHWDHIAEPIAAEQPPAQGGARLRADVWVAEGINDGQQAGTDDFLAEVAMHHGPFVVLLGQHPRRPVDDRSRLGRC